MKKPLFSILGAAACLPATLAAQPAPVVYGPSEVAPTNPQYVDAFARNPLTEAKRGGGVFTGATWDFIGPSVLTFGQVENIFVDLPGDSDDIEDPVVGAIHTVLIHPTNANIHYIGATNGGVWRTDNATALNPTWTPLTDDQPSQSIGALEFDPTDVTHNTLVAGIGRYSSFGRTGGARSGLLRTTDGGQTWSLLPGMAGRNISAVAPRGSTIVAAVNVADNFTFSNVGIFHSTDTGQTWSQISNGNGGATGLPGGVAYDMVGDPNNNSRLYTSIVFAPIVGGVNGIYRSDDTGATWTKVSNAAVDAFISDSSTTNIELSVGSTGEVYASIINTGALSALFRSPNGNAGTFVQLDTPATNENGVDIGVNPGGGKGPEAGSPAAELAGGQGTIHSSILADSSTSTIVYVGGDRQPHANEGIGGSPAFPNSIGANDYSGRLFRGDSSLASGSQFVHLTNSNVLPTAATTGGTASSSSPHADSREMFFDLSGNIVEVDDGGVYKRTNPTSNTGDWESLIGSLGNTEVHDVAYDPVSNVVLVGNQDTGTGFQYAEGDSRFFSISTADGGDVAVARNPNNANQSIRYSSFQRLGAFRRTVWDNTNGFVSQSFPSLTGYDFSGRFVTSVVVNEVNPLRIAIGATNAVWESQNEGASVSAVGPSNGSSFQNALVYGGFLNGTPNADVMYYGTGSALYGRTSGTGSLSVTNYAGSTVNDVAIDSDNYNRVFVVDSMNRVWLSENAGMGFSQVTGNLPAQFLQSCEYIPGPNAGLVVGTSTGIWYMPESDHGNWTLLGGNFPTVPVWDLDYNLEDDILVAGTLGRGVWSVKGLQVVPPEETDVWYITGQ